jgi:hypothetical protein
VPAKIINTIDAVVPEEIAPYMDDMATVSRWGGEGLRSGQWVMKGKSTFGNYLRSGKWDPFPWNEFAPPSSGQTFLVPKSSVKLPQTEGVLGKVKAVTLGQRQYIP